MGILDIAAFFPTFTSDLNKCLGVISQRITFPKHGLIVALDEKRWTDSECVAYKFCIKKISFIGINNKILTEIHKFPFPVQQMLINEYYAVDA
ncbi:hypothetical protein C1645_841279 [Glomus cerebriforme]|uniref:Uncharacterized protein n=1 Tax=Glomus cerebriforme TaxID=658196 RepID=A0A397S0Y4_9GLOM|nr:hypothetical protein C1645_841279 [Glomus cerebriforme]